MNVSFETDISLLETWLEDDPEDVDTLAKSLTREGLRQDPRDQTNEECYAQPIPGRKLIGWS